MSYCKVGQFFRRVLDESDHIPRKSIIGQLIPYHITLKWVLCRFGKSLQVVIFLVSSITLENHKRYGFFSPVIRDRFPIEGKSL